MAVNQEETMLVPVDLRRNPADAEFGRCAVGNHAADFELHLHLVQALRPQSSRPPELRVGHDKLRKFLRRQGDSGGCQRVNPYVFRKRNIADAAGQGALNGLAAAVREVGIQGKLRLVERRTQGANHLRIAHGYGTGGEQVRALHNTMSLSGGMGFQSTKSSERS